jgi:hypothetical protein
MTLLLASIGSVYERAIIDTGRQPEFLFFAAFLLSFGFIRTSAHLIRAQVSWWPGNVEVGGTHIHHLVWGILLILVFGYVGIAFEPQLPWLEITAVAFGIGTGLTLDEFALWLNLKDVYWSQQGRRSIDAVIVAASLSGIVLIGYTAWVDVAEDVEHGVFALAAFHWVAGVVVSLVNAAKEKFGMAFVGLLAWPIGLIGALRLGRAHSPWAHFFYDEEKRERADERFGKGSTTPSEASDAEAAPSGPSAPAPAPNQSAGSG